MIISADAMIFYFTKKTPRHRTKR